jgi:hypothetical protein
MAAYTVLRASPVIAWMTSWATFACLPYRLALARIASNTCGGYPCFFFAAMDSEAWRIAYGPEPSAMQKRCKITRCVYKTSCSDWLTCTRSKIVCRIPFGMLAHPLVVRVDSKHASTPLLTLLATCHLLYHCCHHSTKSIPSACTNIPISSRLWDNFLR